MIAAMGSQRVRQDFVTEHSSIRETETPVLENTNKILHALRVRVKKQ